MYTRIDIINELEQLQSPLAAMQPVNVFTVPDGYFDGLAAAVLRATQGDLILQGVQPPPNATVPEGYFEGLAGSILGKIKAQEAEKADEAVLSPLLQGLRNINVFTVPQGYFEGLADGIVAGQLSPMLEGLRTANVFSVPQGYFEGLDQQVLAAINNQGNEGLGTDLQNLRQTNVFSVPEGYFEGLATAILAKVRPPKAKVVGMGRRILQYAAAAVVVGAMALGVYRFGGSNSGTGTASLALTDVQRQGIAISKDDALFNKEMEQVSSETIVRFLTANGDDVETALAASAVNEQELPSEEDLIVDEMALEDFLGGDDKKSNN
jgi:hypothetical protein